MVTQSTSNSKYLLINDRTVLPHDGTHANEVNLYDTQIIKAKSDSLDYRTDNLTGY